MPDRRFVLVPRYVLLSIALGLSCGVIYTACDSGRRGNGNGNGDGGVADLSMGGNAYGDLGDSDAGICTAGKTPNMCASPLAGNVGCGATELCGTDGTGNGLDDNCDGKVDETCACTPGNVHKCFIGPPGKHGIGACTDGMQTCSGGEFGSWGDCKGSISPQPEICDGVDNDCNGCSDDGLCCDNNLTCPSTVPDVQPYTDVAYMGATYFHGTANAWSWTVSGGPCDQLFATTTGHPPAQSFTITNGDTSTPTIHFTLSGDYTITMTVTDGSGAKQTCTWVQHVAGPGVRFELCWDTTGSNGSDLDLHLHKANSMTNFFSVTTSSGSDTNDDCNYRNCKASSFSGDPAPSWGYTNTAIANCVGGPEGSAWMSLGSCRNPRLDIDNIDTSGVPENINVDNPKNGETFRALVHYYGINDFSNFSGKLISHPMVNIYCGGRLKTTYGQAPDLVPDFAKAGAWASGDMWRVADVTVTVDANGNTTDCTVAAIHPMGATSGYYVGHDANISYNGY